MTDQDLVAMLREIALDEKTSWDGWNAQDVATVESAADAIERLTAEVEALRVQRDQDMFAAGWCTAANWMERDDLKHDVGSPAYLKDMAAAITAIDAARSA